ncbi:MAG: CoA-binding protein [Betaproteobacteria bacterium]
MTSQASVDAFLAQPALALVGMSRSGRKFGNLACRELTAKGYRVHPIHPSAEAIDGHRCYRRFADLPEPVDAVLVVVPSPQAAITVREAAAAGIHHVWLQQGAESPEVLRACRDAGIEAVSGECILMFAKPSGYHRAHRWMWRLLGRLPA